MKLHFASSKDIASWDKLSINNLDGGNFLQSYEFALQKAQDGWKPLFIKNETCAITVLEKKFLSKRLWYIPKGPGVASIEQFDELLPELKEIARKRNVFAIKVEPGLKKIGETLTHLIQLGLKKVRPIQPNFSTVLIDLSPDLETIMKNLNQKGRHAIHRAERDGVTVGYVDSTEENCKIMYDLLAETAAGAFAIRGFDYYRTFWQRFEAAGLGRLFFAYFDGKVVAGAYAIAFGKKGAYKDGASIRKRTVYGASHLLQWHIIKWMKEKEVTVYDLCGAPPSDQINNPDHPHYGIGRFKTSFNKEVTDYIGAYDIVIQPAFYSFWASYGERIALRLYHLGKKSFY
jgi:lipid II:glycine glycyltransferase (peptidoglycan interpeptide bridge formation enzyme)